MTSSIQSAHQAQLNLDVVQKAAMVQDSIQCLALDRYRLNQQSAKDMGIAPLSPQEDDMGHIVGGDLTINQMMPAPPTPPAPPATPSPVAPAVPSLLSKIAPLALAAALGATGVGLPAAALLAWPTISSLLPPQKSSPPTQLPGSDYNNTFDMIVEPPK